MVITSLRLQNYRSHADREFRFSPDVNIIVGPNASGKTNILEAVLVIAQGASYRAKDEDLVEFDKPWARLDVTQRGEERTVKIIKSDGKANKDFIINGKTYKRLGFNTTLPLVYFEPNHLLLLVRGPEQRREYFDDLLGRLNPNYKTLLNKYRRTLSQRNSLLKQPKATALGQIFVWNIRLAEFGEQLVAARSELVVEINTKLSKVYSRIARIEAKALLSYESTFPATQYASRMVQKLEKSTELDFLRGFTATGPHREDYEFTLNDHELGQSASRGETRSLLLSLKAIELGFVENARGLRPILLLDDVFSELDIKRRRALVGALKGYQTIITTTDADTVKKYFKPSQIKIISLKGATKS